MDSPPAPHRQDNEGDISLLLSPTKARLAARESASWRSVDSHLQALFAPNRVPRFERNDATLKALLELVKANEDADEERTLLHEARVEALRGTEKGDEGGLRRKVLGDLEGALSAEGKAALDDLAASAVLLCCPTGNIDGMETQLMALTRDTFSAENELLRLQQTQSYLDRETTQLQTTISNFKASTDPDTLRISDLQSSTVTMNRETKIIGMKLAEYQDRIRSLQTYDFGKVRIEDIVAKEKEIERRQDVLRGLEGKIRELNGLPPELNVARKEVERARGELGEWKGRRERAFEGLVE